MFDADYLVPDITVGSEGVTSRSDVVKQAMRYPKFQFCLRALAMRAPPSPSPGPRTRSAPLPLIPFAVNLRLWPTAFSFLANGEPSWVIGETPWLMGEVAGELLVSQCTSDTPPLGSSHRLVIDVCVCPPSFRLAPGAPLMMNPCAKPCRAFLLGSFW